MSKPLRLTAATLAIAALAPATASAAWTAPTTIDDAIGSNPLAQSAFGGSVLTGWLEPTASLAKRSGDAFGAPTALTAADPVREGLGRRPGPGRERGRPDRPQARAVPAHPGDVRRRRRHAQRHPHDLHRPALLGRPAALGRPRRHRRRGLVVARRHGLARAGRRPPPRPAGLRQAADASPRPRRSAAGSSRGRSSTSPPATAAAAAVTWQFGGDAALPESPLHVLTAGSDGDASAPTRRSRAPAATPTSASRSARTAPCRSPTSTSTSPAMSPRRACAWRRARSARRSPPPRSSRPAARARAPATRSRPRSRPTARATVAWAKPGSRYEEGGTLEVFTRAAERDASARRRPWPRTPRA